MTDDQERAGERPAEDCGAGEAGEDGGPAAGLWRDVPAAAPRLPDPVREAAVRAGLIAAFTLILALIALLSVLAGTWLAVPAVLGALLGAVAATWAVLDVWVTRQVWNQRAGVLSTPSSVARRSRRERRRDRRAGGRPSHLAPGA